MPEKKIHKDPKEVLLTDELWAEIFDENGDFWSVRGGECHEDYIAEEGFVYRPCLGFCGHKQHSKFQCVKINAKGIVIEKDGRKYLTSESKKNVNIITRSYKVAVRAPHNSQVSVTGFMYRTGDDDTKIYYTIIGLETGNTLFIGIPRNKAKEFKPGIYSISGRISNFKGFGTGNVKASYINNPIITEVS